MLHAFETDVPVDCLAWPIEGFFFIVQKCGKAENPSTVGYEVALVRKRSALEDDATTRIFLVVVSAELDRVAFAGNSGVSLGRQSNAYALLLFPTNLNLVEPCLRAGQEDFKEVNVVFKEAH